MSISAVDHAPNSNAGWRPSPTDGLETETIESQRLVEDALSDILARTAASSPVLNRDEHVSFLTRLLSHPLPSYFVGLDASRPWLLYWILHSYAVLDVQLDSASKKRVIDTLGACQNSDGGFGGGPGQLSHLAPTYAAVLALAIVGGQDAYDAVDREGMFRFLREMKQSDGSFTMHRGGEVDCRGVYCAFVVATLLNMLTPSLFDNTRHFLAACQTYEGGLACAANVSPSGEHSEPIGEAHAGYAFCALAAHAIIEPLSSPDSTSASTQKQLDLDALLRWSTSLQGLPIEAQGFRGRTNKLVDGCYAGWSGGIVQLVRLLLPRPDDSDDGSDDAPLFDSAGLQEFVLKMAQAPGGGLRDKPGKYPDAYHSAYNLTGLSTAQHRLVRTASRIDAVKSAFVDCLGGGRIVELARVPMCDPDESEHEANERMRTVYAHMMSFEERGRPVVVGEQANEVLLNHPVFNIAMTQARAMMDYFYLQDEQ